jgi:tetratricopeptide (TPR) repeat protein
MKLVPTTRLFAILFLALFSAAVIDNAIHWSCTSDERLHLSSGYSYLMTRDFRMAPEQPPLVKELAALMLLPLHPDFPVNKAAWDDGDQVGFGDAFTFHNRVSVDRQLLAARIPCIVIALLLGWMVYKWARELHGELGGLVSLFFFSTCPNLVAHSALITTDVAISLFYVAGLYAIRCFYLRQSRVALYAAAVLAAFASLSKYTGLLLYPVCAIVLTTTCFHHRKKEFLLFFYAGCVFLLAWLLSALILYRSGAFLSLYVDGLRNLNFNFHDPSQVSYCLGDIYFGSRWYYYLVALAVKSPVPFLLTIGGSLIALAKRKAEGFDQWLFVLAPAVLFFATVSAAVPDNIGFRYVLPVLPLLQIAAGGIVKTRLVQSKKVLALALALVLWQALGSAFIHPNEISYFNEIAGGPRNGYRTLADSNVDWGQNVKDLQAYSNQQPLLIKPFVIDPALYGIRYLHVSETTLANPVPGTYVFSTHYLAMGRCTWWLRQLPPDRWLGNSLMVYQFGADTGEKEARMYREAAGKWKKGDPFFTNDAGAYFQARKEFSEAAGWFRRTLLLRPDHPTARSDLGFALLENNDDSGYAEIEADLAKFPQKAKTALALANHYLQKGNETRARFWLEQVSRNEIRSLYSTQSAQVADIRLGTLDQMRGHLRLALAHYGQALSWPNDSRRNQTAALIGCGSALGMLHRTTRAVACFEAALKLEPDNSTAHYVYGMLLSKDPASRDEALRQLQEAVRSESDPRQKQVIEDAVGRVQQQMTSDIEPSQATPQAPSREPQAQN